MTTLVLVHGAGNTSHVWRRVQEELAHASVAVDLPGRHDRPADITRVTIDDAAGSIAADVEATTTGPVALVGHSVGGIVLPGVAARLGRRVEHLVFVAGLIAPHDARVVDTLRPGDGKQMSTRLDDLRASHGNRVFRPVADGAAADLREITDAQVVMSIDSMNYISQVVSWDGVDPALPRTFVRCTRDALQSPELQDLLIESCAATEVVELDSGHTPAIDAPAELAALLDGIAQAAPRRTYGRMEEKALRPD